MCEERLLTPPLLPPGSESHLVPGQDNIYGPSTCGARGICLKVLKSTVCKQCSGLGPRTCLGRPVQGPIQHGEGLRQPLSRRYCQEPEGPAR